MKPVALSAVEAACGATTVAVSLLTELLLTILLVASVPLVDPAGIRSAWAQPAGSGDLPRFASLRSDEVRFRRGPNTDHPIDWVYRRRYLPVEIYQSYKNWRRVRDPYGNTGWVHRRLLTPRRRAIVVGETLQDMIAQPLANARVVARLEPGVIGDLMECDSAYCRLAVKDGQDGPGYVGWVRRRGIWGIHGLDQGKF